MWSVLEIYIELTAAVLVLVWITLTQEEVHEECMKNECRNNYQIHVQLKVNCGIKELFVRMNRAKRLQKFPVAAALQPINAHIYSRLLMLRS